MMAGVKVVRDISSAKRLGKGRKCNSHGKIEAIWGGKKSERRGRAGKKEGDSACFSRGKVLNGQGADRAIPQRKRGGVAFLDGHEEVKRKRKEPWGSQRGVARCKKKKKGAVEVSFTGRGR